MKVTVKALPLLAVLLMPTASLATVFGGSNLGFSGYPEFSEVEPTPPYSNDQYAWESYKQEVDAYTAKAKQYLEDANSDIQRIQEAQQEAINKANSVVQEYNSKVR